MDAACHSTTVTDHREPTASPRRRHACLWKQATSIGFWWRSRRQVAQQLGVPDSSFRDCLRQHQRRCQESRFPRSFVEFCQSPEGLDFLHRQLVALHLVFGQANDCGLRNLCRFLELSGLDEFLPASYGAQQAFAAGLETALCESGQEEEQRLLVAMPHREISLVEDETFHPQICLVAIEPVSDFLLLEQYAPKRDAETWNRCLDERLAGWSVTVCQVTSDEASALIAHTQQHLGAHHSPDLFHVQQDTVRAVSFSLAGQTRSAYEALAKAQRQVVQRQAELAACQEQCPESAAAVERQSDEAVAGADQARQRLATSSEAVPAWRGTTASCRCGIMDCTA